MVSAFVSTSVQLFLNGSLFQLKKEGQKMFLTGICRFYVEYLSAFLDSSLDKREGGALRNWEIKGERTME